VSQIRIVLADDHRVVRLGLRLVLEVEPDFEVLGEAGDVTEARRKVDALNPDVLILDLNMPGEASLDAIPSLREQYPDTQVVVLTMQDDPSFARDALRAGALGYVLKESAESELVEAVRRAAQGLGYLNPGLGGQLATDAAVGSDAPDALSPRELEVLALLAEGHTNAEIAARLFLSPRTVESHRANIQSKTGRKTRAELVAYAREHQLG
jgi:two-component system response regulator NreC